jgi:hypothetical protein
MKELRNLQIAKKKKIEALEINAFKKEVKKEQYSAYSKQ